ncbi:O-antigen polymerase [Saccharothrix coeruleofusca]|uniref:O-antigen polymerase n=2 Tax=Saccharothrix coeruleofusca TaxID=33919 RepID=A0A918ASH5_9PSEU|nr:O-antigen polymerase [Saccharothrix coeruleofusca]
MGTAVLRALACLTVALAPVEGYLLQVHPQLAKVPSALLVLAWIAVRARQRRAPEAHPVHAVLALLTLVLLASSAVHAGGPFALAYLPRWLPFLVVTVVLVDVAAREVPIRALLAATVAGASAAGAGALHSLVADGATRASGPLQDPNDLAYFLVGALPLLVALLPDRESPDRGRRRALLAVAGVVLVAGAAATFSRGGALALACAVAWLVARRALPLRAVAVGAVALAGLAGVVALLAGPVLDKAVREKEHIAGTNVDTRELRWQAAARMLARQPVLGVGPGGFRDGYPAASHNAEVDEQTPVAHNMYLEVGAELGVPGLALFLGLIATTAVISQRWARAGPDPRPAVAVQASLIAVVVASAFLSQQYYLPLWALVAVAAAADLRLRRTIAGARAARDQ